MSKNLIMEKVCAIRRYSRIIIPLLSNLEDLVSEGIISELDADKIFMQIVDGISNYEFNSVVRGFVELHNLKGTQYLKENELTGSIGTSKTNKTKKRI